MSKKFEWALPVILGFVLGTLGTVIGNNISEKPDFSISASPPMIKVTGPLGQKTIDIKLTNVHNVLHSFDHTIGLIAQAPGGTSIETSFYPPQITFDKKSESISKMNINIENPLKKGHYPIEIIAMADDGTQRRLVLDLEIISIQTTGNGTLIAGVGRK
jgi:hypothetical protein